MSPVKQKNSNNAAFIAPEIFHSCDAIAGFSTRLGGVSKSHFSSLNLGKSTKDDPEAVLENRERMFRSVGATPDDLALCGQVHGVRVLEVDTPGLFVGYDGAVTTTPGILLGLTAADCASVLLLDNHNRVAGACHAGWRGVAGNIVQDTIRLMHRKGSEPERIRAYVSPCISRENFEIGEEIVDRFDSDYVYEPGVLGEKYHVDLKAILYDQLLKEGLQSAHIEIDPRCTFADTDLFFSHRAENGNTGRMMGFLGLV